MTAHRRAGAVLAALLVSAALIGSARPATAEATTVTVCASCAQTSLHEAVAAARPGDRIEVSGGVHPGGLVIDKPLTLVGADGATIDGGGTGSLIHATGVDVTIEGFVLRATGSNHDKEDSAIVVEGGRATIVHNRIEDALFGIYLKNAHGSVVRDNVVLSKQVDIALRGDGIKVWYSDDVLIEGNQASDGRDIILWYSNGGVVKNNVFDRGRYGLHLMFSDAARIEGNSLRANSIGLYIMYSRDPVVVGNTLADNHGPSGGGLGLKDVDRAIVEANRFINNQIAAQIDTSPRELSAHNVWRDNVFAYNEIGVGFMPSVRRNTLTGNSFIDNTEHVAILGRGELQDITWAVDGRGNYWSDYAGYDADGDGVGDRPYQSRDLFESLMDEQPNLRLFLFSPASMAIDFAAKAVPEIRPQMKLEDPAPLMTAPASPLLPPLEPVPGGARVILGAGGLLTMAGAAIVVARMRPAPAHWARRSRGRLQEHAGVAS